MRIHQLDMEDRIDPDGQNLVSVLHTLYASHRKFKKDLHIAMQSAFGDDFEELNYWLKSYSLGSLFKSGELEKVIL